MALIDTVATTRVVLPSMVAGHANGKLPASMLRNFDGRGALLTIVSYGMQALHLAAFNDQIDGFGPIDTETVGRYRTYDQQVNLFKARYVTTDTGRSSKTWNGVRYWLRKGAAMAATPGTSNHGWAAADDVAEESDGTPGAEGMSDRQLTWMRENAPGFGFGLEQRAERWHWHWIAGDVLPKRAVAVLARCGIDHPFSASDQGDDDMTPAQAAQLNAIDARTATLMPILADLQIRLAVFERMWSQSAANESHAAYVTGDQQAQVWNQDLANEVHATFVATDTT